MPAKGWDGDGPTLVQAAIRTNAEGVAAKGDGKAKVQTSEARVAATFRWRPGMIRIIRLPNAPAPPKGGGYTASP